MSSEPIKDFGEGVGKGATEGLLNYSDQKIQQLIGLFKDGKLKFIGDQETIRVAKETKRSGEWAFYKTYIKDKDLLFIIRLGLTLRKVEKDSRRLDNLKDKIRRKYDIKGLHVAYFVQNGLLNRYVGILLDDLDSAIKLETTIINTLKNIEKHTIFVDWRYEESQLLKDSMTLTAAHLSEIFIISGIGSAAKIVRDCEEKLVEVLKKYELEKISTGEKEVFFFKRII